MNYVLVSSKKTASSYSGIISKTPNVNLLGVEHVIKNNFISKVTDTYNPHTVIITKDVPIKTGGNIIEIISLLRFRMHDIRIIYVYGTIEDQSAFDNFSEKLISLGVFDIITKPFIDVFPTIAEHAWDLQDLYESLKSTDESTKAYICPEETREVVPLVSSKKNVKLDYESAQIATFDVNNIETIHEQTYKLPEKFSISISALEHNVGCTHLCFEIATYLKGKSKRVCVVLFDETVYLNLTKFYDVPEARSAEGIIINDIAVIPYTIINSIKKEDYDVVISDYGVTPDEEQSKVNIRIKLCDAADWHISNLMNYINTSTSSDSIDSTVFFFSPLTNPSKFHKYNRQLFKSGYKAYRLHASIDSLQPCPENIIVYDTLIKGGI